MFGIIAQFRKGLNLVIGQTDDVGLRICSHLLTRHTDIVGSRDAT